MFQPSIKPSTKPTSKLTWFSPDVSSVKKLSTIMTPTPTVAPMAAAAAVASQQENHGLTASKLPRDSSPHSLIHSKGSRGSTTSYSDKRNAESGLARASLLKNKQKLNIDEDSGALIMGSTDLDKVYQHIKFRSNDSKDKKTKPKQRKLKLTGKMRQMILKNRFKNSGTLATASATGKKSQSKIRTPVPQKEELSKKRIDLMSKNRKLIL